MYMKKELRVLYIDKMRHFLFWFSYKPTMLKLFSFWMPSSPKTFFAIFLLHAISKEKIHTRYFMSLVYSCTLRTSCVLHSVLHVFSSFMAKFWNSFCIEYSCFHNFLRFTIRQYNLIRT